MKRVRTYAIVAAALVLAGSTGAVLISSGRVAEAYDPGGTWSLTGNTATSTSTAGLVTTVSTVGDATLSGQATFSHTNGPVSSEFDPAISMGTDALRWSVGAGCFNTGRRGQGATADNLGTVTIAFSEPVTNPALHLEGIGALAQNTSPAPRARRPRARTSRPHRPRAAAPCTSTARLPRSPSPSASSLRS